MTFRVLCIYVMCSKYMHGVSLMNAANGILSNPLAHITTYLSLLTSDYSLMIWSRRQEITP